MSKTITVTALSDAAIKRTAGADGVYRIRCGLNRDLRLQLNGDRTSGGWYARSKGSWSKFADWPAVNTARALELLQHVRVSVISGDEVRQERFYSVGDVLGWYRQRVRGDRNISNKRRAAVLSILDVHLIPLVGALTLSEVSRNALDEQLMWPLQSRLSVSYIRSIFRVLKMAFAQARRLELLAVNQLAELSFTDFVQAKIKSRPARLSLLDLESTVQLLVTRFDTHPVASMLGLMMLCHGTRIGETRNALWRHICLQRRIWLIPAGNTKTGSEHVLPLTDQVCALLRVYRGCVIDSESVFAVQHTSKMLTEQAAYSNFRELGKGKWTSHDLRKLARTGWVELGVDHLIGEMLLNHSVGFTAETYINTSADNLKLDALSRWHAKLDECGFDVLHGGTEAVL